MFKQQQTVIGENLCDVFKKVRFILAEDISLDNVSKCVVDLGHLQHSMQEWTTLLSNMHTECISKESEIKMENKLKENILNEESSDSDSDNGNSRKNRFKFITLANDKSMNWAEISSLEEDRDDCIEQIDNMLDKMTNPQTSKKISTINGVYTGPLSIPIISHIKDIPPAIHWFEGDGLHKAGLYMCLTPECYIEVPFPHTIDGTKNSSRNNSIKCKYVNADDCKYNRESLAAKYNSEVRKCNFAHAGDKYIKIGTSFRCPNAPSLGNHYDLKSDMQKVNLDDIKMLLMYSASDILLSTMWWQQYSNFKQNRDSNDICILNNLDIC